MTSPVPPTPPEQDAATQALLVSVISHLSDELSAGRLSIDGYFYAFIMLLYAGLPGGM